MEFIFRFQFLLLGFSVPIWGYFLEGYCLDLSLFLCPPLWVYIHIFFMTRRPTPVHASLGGTSTGCAVYSIYPFAGIYVHGISALLRSGTFWKI